MKRFLIAMVALCFALAASLTGCARSDSDYAGLEVYEPAEKVASEQAAPPALGKKAANTTDGDLVVIEGSPVPVEGEAVAKRKAPAVVVPEEKEQVETADVVYTQEELERKIKAFEKQMESEPRAIQEIIAAEYDYVPSVSFVAPKGTVEEAVTAFAEQPVAESEPVSIAIVADAAATEAEIAARLIVPDDADEPADNGEDAHQSDDMAADYRKFLDIESYVAEDTASAESPQVAAEPAAPEVVKDALPAVEDFVKDTESIPVPLTKAPEEKPAEREELGGFLLPPPLFDAPAHETAAFSAGAEADSGHELSLEGFDDSGLEFFGKLSESLLEAGG